MEKNSQNMIKLFTSTFYLSAFTFGGGYVIVPLMKKRFVDQLHWIQEDEMLDLIAIAQSAPGPIAVNASILVGWKVMGGIGALLAILGTILPPLITLSLLSIGYTAFKENLVVSVVLKGMMAGVCAVIADVALSMFSKLIAPKKVLPIIIFIGVFVAHYVFHINVVYILLCCAVLGIIMQRKETIAGKE